MDWRKFAETNPNELPKEKRKNIILFLIFKNLLILIRTRMVNQRLLTLSKQQIMVNRRYQLKQQFIWPYSERMNTRLFLLKEALNCHLVKICQLTLLLKRYVLVSLGGNFPTTH